MLQSVTAKGCTPTAAVATGLRMVISGDPFPTELLVGRASEVAHKLLGARLVVGSRSGRIVEVEAYEGSNDGASHAARGPTPRNAIMFGPAGYLYVYKIYGVHWCANVVTTSMSEPGAVLVRAIEPLGGLAGMWADRPKARQEADLGSGPGKLCAALGISGEYHGDKMTSSGDDDLDFDHSRVQLFVDEPPKAVASGPRIGISKSVELPWRFAESGSAFMSRPGL